MAAGKSYRSRTRFLGLLMGVIAIIILVQLIRVQFGPFAPVFTAWTEAISGQVEEIVSARGIIYDRDGHVLAMNRTMYYLEIELSQVTAESQKAIALVLSEMLGIPEQDLLDQLNTDWGAQGLYRIRLTRPIEEEGRWPIMIDQMTADILNNFMQDRNAPDLGGLALDATSQRTYPSGELAGHLLGFVNQEGRGFFGIEGYYDNWLSGNSVTVEYALVPMEAQLSPSPQAGVNLVLTIDMEIQLAVEKILESAVEGSRGDRGEIIVMDPATGEILAMAAYPRLDPNNYEIWLLQEDADQIITPAVAGNFEPGSTFKILTMAAALDTDSVELSDIFIDTGEIIVGGEKIQNWNNEAWGPQTMLGCMQHSLNVCLAHVAANELGTSLFYGYMNGFGIGQMTGIDLAGERTGEMRTHRHPLWTEVDIGTNSFGQGISLTPVQLLSAVNAVANGGVMVQPHIVRQIAGPQGSYWPKTTVLGKPISARTANEISEMLVETLEQEGRLAQVQGYRIAGKTGTAQIPTEHGYDQHQTIASFIGWGPVDDPAFIIFVRVDKPRTSPWGSVIAAPIFQDVAERLVVLLDIPPDLESQTGTDGS